MPFQGPGPSLPPPPFPPWIYFTSPYCHPRMLPPWSNFLLAIIWWVRTVSHWQVQMTLGLGRIWLLNVALASHQAPVCLFLTAPKGLATGGGLLGQLATEGCNHSLWHIWHRLSVCSTIARACVHGLLYPVKPEDGSIEVERVAMKHFPTLQLFICCNRLKEISKGLATMTFFLLKKKTKTSEIIHC